MIPRKEEEYVIEFEHPVLLTAFAIKLTSKGSDQIAKMHKV